jgi:tetratricopeptide (TPR) repeat protein
VLQLAVVLGLTLGGMARAESARDYIERGIEAGKKGQYDQAIAYYNKALELNPRDTDAYRNRGVEYAQKGQLDQAIADYTKTLELNPRFPMNPYINRGVAYLFKYQLDQAITDFTKALELNPRDTKAYKNRALCFYSKKEYGRAWEDVRKAQSLGGKIAPKFLEDLRRASGRER